MRQVTETTIIKVANAVPVQPPILDRNSMPNEHEVAVLFAKITPPEGRGHALNTAEAMAGLTEIQRCFSATVAKYGGTLIKVVKVLGNRFLCTFPTADLAVRFACDFNAQMDKPFTADGSSTMLTTVVQSIRIGITFGPVIPEEDGDILGHAVNMAARVVELAKAQEILITKETSQLLTYTPGGFTTRLVNRTHVKGIEEVVDLYEVVWRTEEVTNLSIKSVHHLQERMVRSGQIVLTHPWGELVVDDKRPAVVLGRDPAADVCCDDDRISRHHVRIEQRRNLFVLIDKSMNGTYLRDEEGKESFVRNDETVLHGAGEFSLGRAFDDPPCFLIRFQIPEADPSA